MFKFVILILLVAAVSGEILADNPFGDLVGGGSGGSGGATPTPRDDAELKKIIQDMAEQLEHSVSNMKVLFFQLNNQTR